METGLGDAGDNLAGQKYEIDYVYYGQNAQQKQILRNTMKMQSKSMVNMMWQWQKVKHLIY